MFIYFSLLLSGGIFYIHVFFGSITYWVKHFGLKKYIFSVCGCRLHWSDNVNLCVFFVFVFVLFLYFSANFVTSLIRWKNPKYLQNSMLLFEQFSLCTAKFLLRIYCETGIKPPPNNTLEFLLPGATIYWLINQPTRLGGELTTCKFLIQISQSKNK